jgi:hypothetical protein
MKLAAAFLEQEATGSGQALTTLESGQTGKI